MNTLNIDVQEIAATVAQQVVSDIDFNSLMLAGGESEAAPFTLVSNLTKGTHPSIIVNQVQPILVEAGLLLNTEPVGKMVTSITGGVFKLVTDTQNNTITITSAVIDGKIDTSKIEVYTNLGRLNLLTALRKRILVNTKRMTVAYISIDSLFNIHLREADIERNLNVLNTKRNRLVRERTKYQTGSDTRLRRLATSELTTRITAIEKKIAELK